MLVDLLLGVVQGLTEWLPVSSEGVVTAVRDMLVDSSLGESIFYSLWLHLGTVLSVLVAFRKELFSLAQEALADPKHPSPLLWYLLLSTFVSALIGLPLLITIEEGSTRLGALAMAFVGVFMLLTGTLQFRRKVEGERGRDRVGPKDAILAGAAQGLAVLPGLSRSGLTVSVLLSRGIHRREALVLSFLMSIPASLGAGLYSGVEQGLLTSKGPLLAGLVAGIVGFVSIRALLSVADRISFASLVIFVGLAVIVGAVWQSFN